MTPPKPVDLLALKRNCEIDGWQDIHWMTMDAIIEELEYLRARVKELEDGK